MCSHMGHSRPGPSPYSSLPTQWPAVAELTNEAGLWLAVPLCRTGSGVCRAAHGQGVANLRVTGHLA
eukprot:COSAG01_NODE_3669_length_5811_cov_6.420868_10_plen_66_part_01